MLAFGGTVAADFALSLVGQFFGGPLADRGSVRRMAFIADQTRGIVIIAAAALVAVTGSIWPILLASAYASLLKPLSRASIFRLMPAVVPAETLAWANSTRSALTQAGQLLGVGLVGVIQLAIPPAATFAVNGVSYLVAGFLVGAVRVAGDGATGGRVATPMNRTLVGDWIMVVKVVLSHRSLALHILLSTSTGLSIAMINLVLAPINQRFGGNPIGFSVLDGAMIAAAVLARRLKPERSLLLLVVMLAVQAWLFLGLAFTPSLLTAIAATASGVAVTIATTVLDTTLRVRCPSLFRGRIATIQTSRCRS